MRSRASAQLEQPSRRDLGDADRDAAADERAHHPVAECIGLKGCDEHAVLVAPPVDAPAACGSSSPGCMRLGQVAHVDVPLDALDAVTRPRDEGIRRFDGATPEAVLARRLTRHRRRLLRCRGAPHDARSRGIRRALLGGLAPVLVPHRRRSPRHDPLERHRTTTVRTPLDVEAMDAAARSLSDSTTSRRTASPARRRRRSARCWSSTGAGMPTGVLVATREGRRVLPQHGARARRRVRRGRRGAARRRGRSPTSATRASARATSRCSPRAGYPHRGRLPRRSRSSGARGADASASANWHVDGFGAAKLALWCRPLRRHPKLSPPPGRSRASRANTQRSGIHEHLLSIKKAALL